MNLGNRRADARCLRAHDGLNFEFVQRRLEYFTHRRGWKRAQDTDVLGDRSALGNGVGGEVDELLFGGSGAGLELDIGDRQFSGVGIGAADGCDQSYCRMLAEGLLDDLGVDVVATADDQLFLATGKPKVAIGILPPEIAGVEPALAADFGPQPFVVAGVEVA